MGHKEDGEPPSAGSSQTIHCTPGHPFFVEGRGWVLAGELRAGDELEARGERVVVAAVEVRAEQASTFNFEVSCHHTYRVSGARDQAGVLVHNTSKAGMFRALMNKTRRHLRLHNRGLPREARLTIPRIKGKPRAENADLQRIIDHHIYKAYGNKGRFGAGSTADAIRAERFFGEAVTGEGVHQVTGHLTKGREMINALGNISANNVLSPADRTIVRKITQDLQAALAGF